MSKEWYIENEFWYQGECQGGNSYTGDENSYRKVCMLNNTLKREIVQSHKNTIIRIWEMREL